ncbi:MAG: hypothetical protein NT033_06425 [Candidatus Omnitrophica bacterium]|nr:hypothetical protein [Candidatus Omnitrophota bacterium]
MSKKGIGLIITLLTMSAMLVLTAAIFSRSINENFIGQRFTRSTQAFWLAEAGAQNAFRALNDGTISTWTLAGTDDYTMSENLGSGSYSVTVACRSCSNPAATSTGTVNGVQRTVVVRFITKSSLTNAVLAKGSITMSGNGKTDSYDSSKGQYGGNNKGSDGDVATDGTGTGIITLSGNATVNGDANTGTGGTVVQNSNAKVTGTISSDNNISIPSVEVPSCLTSLSGDTNLSVGGNNTQPLPSGNYRYSSMSIESNGKLNVTGTVKIYLTGNPSLNISGNGKLIISGGGNLIIYADGVCNLGGNGIVNSTTVPKNFILKSTYTGAQGINITGNGNLQGIVYAPDTDILNSGDGSVFGALIGKTANISGNGDVHYDESLAHFMDFSNCVIDNWADENNPYPLETPP